VVVLPEHLALQALLLLRVVCSVRAAAVVGEALLAQEVQGVQEVEALAAAVARVVAAHTPQVLAA